MTPGIISRGSLYNMVFLHRVYLFKVASSNTLRCTQRPPAASVSICAASPYRPTTVYIMAIPHSFIQELLTRVNVVGRYVQLKKTGDNLSELVFDGLLTETFHREV
jgi:DNA primase (bacterial type)